jgi:transposase
MAGLGSEAVHYGGKPKLLGISKRGNKYLRKQLIHGARAALPHIAERDTLLGRSPARRKARGPVLLLVWSCI